MTKRLTSRAGWIGRWLIGAITTAAGLMAQGAELGVHTGGAGIQAALESAQAGDRIVVAPGHYRERLVVDKPVQLLGEPGAVLDGGGAGDVIRIRAPNVTVQGFELRGSGRDLTAMDAVIFIEREGTGARILDNAIHSRGFGIWVDASRNVRIVGNRIQGDTALRSQDRGNGIHLFNTALSLVADNEVWHTRDGIYIDVSNHNVLRANRLHHLRYGIHYMYSHDNQVLENRTHDTRTGYALMQSQRLTVRGNRSEGDENYGILLNYIVSSTIEGNEVRAVQSGSSRAGGGSAVTGAEGKALFVYNSQFNRIRGNIFAASGIGIHLTAGSEDNAIHGNTFDSNRVQVKYVATREQEWSADGGGNYWSDYLGWDRDRDGIGDRPYQPVDGIDRLLWKYPTAKILMHSPAVQTLRWVQEQFPVLRPPGVQDSHPLMRPPRSEGDA